MAFYKAQRNTGVSTEVNHSLSKLQPRKTFPNIAPICTRGRHTQKQNWLVFFWFPLGQPMCQGPTHRQLTFSAASVTSVLIVALLITGLEEWYHIFFFILVWFYPNTVWLLLSSRTVCKIAQTSCWSTLILHIWARRPHMENTGLIIRPQFSALFTWLPSGSNYCFSVTLIHKITLFSDSSTEWLSCSNVKSLYKMHKVEALSLAGKWIAIHPLFPLDLKHLTHFPY